ncbi:three-helix bundle dimerization domain-containing protein [Microbacterium sp. B2969]|uniref:Three-helix bundle dimerization domain-containing protein n=1 Tax=Microbacterium alkaliflavum TaxID=3248839 RepID=A0ABW7Q493_9MICO
MAAEINEEVAVQEIVDRLAEKFPMLPRERVTEVVREVHSSMDAAPVRDFVPVLVERGAKDRLKPEAKALSTAG